MKLTANELTARRRRFTAEMDKNAPDWDTALIVSKVNQYYFTGTMQDAILLIKRDGTFSYYVRRSYERAADESPLDPKIIKPMQSYRDISESGDAGNVYIEADIMPVIMLDRLKKYFTMKTVKPLDTLLRKLRQLKSPYELYWARQAGEMLRRLFDEAIPGIFRENISEMEFAFELGRTMAAYGYQGITRFYQFQTEITMGQIGFGENSLYPTSFDGPNGSRGNSAAVPVAGSHERKLKKGDLVMVDLGFGINGYHSDKTQLYSFGAKPPKEAILAHKLCLDIEKRTAERLRPGEIPSKIYKEITTSIPESAKAGFMGFGKNAVKFLGHGVGLHIDEFPVIAHGFDDPLEADMIIALEPKKAVPGIGMTGVEDTFAVTTEGAVCLTGGGRDIIEV